MPDFPLSFSDDVSKPVQERVKRLMAEWNVAGTQGAEVSLLAGGASNVNLRLETEAGAWALRLCMPDADRWGVDRAAAIQAQRDASTVGLAPQLVASSLPEGHYLSEFVVSRMLTKERLRSEHLLPVIASTLRALNATPTTSRRFSPFDDLRIFLELGAAEDAVPPAGYEELLAKTLRIEALFTTRKAPTAFCHSDHVPQNWLQVDNRFVLVDWDYAGTGWTAFELASFACQCELNDAETEVLLHSYDPNADDGARARVELMRFVAGVREATWAVMAEPILGGQTTPADGWTYKGYAAANLEQARSAVEGRLSELMAAAREVSPGALV